MSTTQREVDQTTWNPTKLLVKTTETIDIKTAIYADQKMLENMAYRAVTVSNIAICKLLEGDA